MKNKEKKNTFDTTEIWRGGVYASINVYSNCSPLLSEQSIMTGPTYLKR
jgi:hypothetical protein